jgi:hypothetical protein
MSDDFDDKIRFLIIEIKYDMVGRESFEFFSQEI